MKIPFSWLQSYFSSSLDIQVVAKQLTQAGLEIEQVSKPAPFGKYFVVGLVESVEKHKDADRLLVCKVRLKKKEIHTIVCGAPNVQVGQYVAVVLPGGTLPTNGMEIKETEIRGVISSGMICAEDELGLGSDHDGILVLDKTTAGVCLDSVQLQDTVLDAEVTANRPDLLSVQGVARELAAVSGKKIIQPAHVLKESTPGIQLQYKAVVAKNVASSYLLKYVANISTSKSPQWLKARLHSVGVEVRESIVDITNYVLYETGQPLHAFDADKVSGKTIRVRFAKPKETIILLDGKQCLLTPSDIVIADNKGPIALAGIMGGERTAVSKDTKNVLLEAASFASHIIRKTSKRFGIHTDAANRFERGVPESAIPEALTSAASLLQEITGARVAKSVIGIKPKKKNTKPVVASVKNINAIIGSSIAPKQMKMYLERLGCVVALRGISLAVTPPAYRIDIQSEIDIAEEVARLYGYHKLRPVLPMTSQQVPVIDPILLFMSQARQVLVGGRYTEVVLPSFYGKNKIGLGTLPEEEYRQLLNPVDASAPYLRSDILPSLIGVLEKTRKSEQHVRIFEIGQVFSKALKAGNHEWRIAFVVSSQTGGSLISLQKDFLQFIEQVLHIDGQRIHFGNGKQLMDIKINTTPVGYITIKPLKKGMVVVACECSVSELFSFQEKEVFTPLKKYPTVHRDIAVVVPLTMDFITLMRQIKRASALVTHVELFDAHPQSDVSVSYAFHISLESDEKTLSATEVDMELTSIERALQQKGGIIRS